MGLKDKGQNKGGVREPKWVRGSITEHVESARKQYGDGNQRFQWAEVAKHDKKSDCWVVVHGNVYDLTNFLDKHPGGLDVLNGAGGDVTEIFEFMHPKEQVKKGPPQRFKIGKIRDYRITHKFDKEKYYDLKARMEKAIPKEERHDSTEMYIKSAFWVIAFYLVLYRLVKYLRFVDLLVYIFVAGQAAINIMHDGCHFAFSENISINFIAGLAMEMVCSSYMVWSRSHNFAHHPNTQHYEREMHFINQDWIRLHWRQPRMWYHKWQKYYIWPVMSGYGFNDFRGTFDNLPWFYNFPHRKGHVSNLDWYGHSFVLTWFVALAGGSILYTHGFYWFFPFFWGIIFGVGHGFMWYINVNHWNILNDHTDDENYLDNGWAVQTYKNCTNFGCDNVFFLHLSGGLNMHKEHHLFPGYAHSNFPKMRHTIEKWGKDQGLEYQYFNTLYGALWGHYKFCEGLGIYDKPPPYKWDQKNQCLIE